jgi:hypothetical protein
MDENGLLTHPPPHLPLARGRQSFNPPLQEEGESGDGVDGLFLTKSEECEIFSFTFENQMKYTVQGIVKSYEKSPLPIYIPCPPG